MAKISNETIADWTARADAVIDRATVVTGVSAWNVAHNLGFTNEAYKDRDILDAHIQTALEKVFPNAVFRDKKVY